jgi:hypothetical protein
LGSIFGSHTLVAYPIAARFGISKKRAATTAVGGTIITDTSALLVLAVVAASTRGVLDAAFWLQLVGYLGLYFVLIWFALPRLGRWFFRNEQTGGVAEYVFVLSTLFAGAYLAGVAGVEPIVGGFLVGLSLNRLLPEQGLLSNRIRFVGEAFFIPFFLLSVGMLADARVLLAGPQAWQVMVAMTVTVIATKWLAARLSQQFFGRLQEPGDLTPLQFEAEIKADRGAADLHQHSEHGLEEHKAEGRRCCTHDLGRVAVFLVCAHGEQAVLIAVLNVDGHLGCELIGDAMETRLAELLGNSGLRERVIALQPLNSEGPERYDFLVRQNRR